LRHEECDGSTPRTIHQLTRILSLKDPYGAPLDPDPLAIPGSISLRKSNVHGSFFVHNWKPLRLNSICEISKKLLRCWRRWYRSLFWIYVATGLGSENALLRERDLQEGTIREHNVLPHCLIKRRSAFLSF